MALSGCDDVSDSDEAIAAAEQACAHVIYQGAVPPKQGDKPGWLAYPQKSEDGLIKGWRVYGDYDASGNGGLAYVQLEVFVPRNGKPTDCVGIVN